MGRMAGFAGLGLILAGTIGAAAAREDPAPGEAGIAPRALWDRRVVSAPACAPVLSGDTLWVVGVDRKVRSLDAETGKRHWRRAVPGRVIFPPVPCGDLLLVPVGGAAPSVAALSRRDGRLRWNLATRTAPVGLAWRAGMVCVATAHGEVIGIDPSDGSEIWEHDHETPLAGMAASDGELFVLARRDSLWCHDAGTGTQRWSVATTGSHMSPPLSTAGALLRVSYEGELVQHDPASGAEIRRTRLTAPQVAPARADGEGAAACVAAGGEMEVVRIDTGRIEQTLAWKETVAAGATSWGPWWVVPSQKGTVRSASRTGGRLAWALTFDAAIAEPPAVAAGRIAFVDDRGHVVVYLQGNPS
jgi:outer membrane protein assembly factor BamB